MYKKRPVKIDMDIEKVDDDEDVTVPVMVVKPGATLTKDQAMEHMRATVTAYKVPKAVEFRDALPTTNVGKILCRQYAGTVKRLGLELGGNAAFIVFEMDAS